MVNKTSETPKKKKYFIIDGSKIKDLDSFYDEVQRVLCPNFSGFGRNLDAFVDILRGGFGTFDHYEPIILELKNRNKIAKAVGGKFKTIEEIIKEAENVEYIF